MKTVPVAVLAAAALCLALSCAGSPTTPVDQASVPAAETAAETAVDAESAATETVAEPEAKPAVESATEPAAGGVEEAADNSAEEPEAAVDPIAAAAAAANYATSTLEPLAAYSGASAESAAAIGRAYDLACLGKWRSAFDSLRAFDSQGKDPFVLAMEIDLMLGGALRSDLHTSFALQDLAVGETVDGLRGREGEFELFPFDPPALAEAQAKAGVAIPAVLSKALGDYFYDVISYFAGQWTLPDEEIAEKCMDGYAKAYAAGAFDLESLSRLSQLLLKAGRNAEAEPVIRSAIERSPDDPDLRLNLAICVISEGRKEEGMKILNEAIVAYGDSPSRLQALAVAARTSAELGDIAGSDRYLLALAQAMPDNPTPGLLRHMIAVERGWAMAANAAADALAKQYASSPQVVRTLVSTWYGQGQIAEAKAFLERSIAGSADEAGAATLNFYLAVLIGQDAATDEDRVLALAALDKAEAGFKQSAASGDEVFGAIAELRASITGVEAPAEEAVPADVIEPAAAPVAP
jgi:tetratricopeptide (TPR) repeat protein